MLTAGLPLSSPSCLLWPSTLMRYSEPTQNDGTQGENFVYGSITLCKVKKSVAN